MSHSHPKQYFAATQRAVANADAIEWEELPSLAGSLKHRLVQRGSWHLDVAPRRGAHDSAVMYATGFAAPWENTMPAARDPAPDLRELGPGIQPGLAALVARLLSKQAAQRPSDGEALAAELRAGWNIEFDDAGAIGKRYRRQDEIGTPYCVTVDFETIDDNAVTVRERDSMQQERISLDGISTYFAERLLGC